MTQQVLRELVALAEKYDHETELGHLASELEEQICTSLIEAIPALKALLGEQREAQEWYPERCPITQRPFFMTIEHPEHGMVPTYGGPYDSYTIPERDDDGDWICERYDHDDGAWVEGWESTGLVVVKDSVLHSAPPLAESVGDVKKADELAQKILMLLDGYNLEGLDKERVRLFCYQSRHMQQGKS